MEFFIQLNNSSFRISRSLAILIKERNSNYDYDVNTNNKTSVIFLGISSLPLFQAHSPISSTHFYITFSNKKFRVNKNFYNFLVSQTKKSSQVNLDKFFTRQNIAKLCVSSLLSSVIINKQDLIIEPSAGNGSFINPLNIVNCKKVFLDISPENNKIKTADFLK